MSNSNETSSADLNSIKTGRVLVILVGIGLVIVGFYFFNFNSHILKNEGWWKVFQNLSADAGNWGVFGDYVGGILNPVIAAFAFYLIAKTYELQKSESTKTIKIAALTALLNSNLTKIGLLRTEKVELLGQIPQEHQQDMLRDIENDKSEKNQFEKEISTGLNMLSYREYYDLITRVPEIDREIEILTNKNFELEEKITFFL